MQFASPDNNVLSLAPFDIPLTVTNPEAPRFKILKNVMIQTTEESSDEDTTDIKVAYTCICSHIQRIY